MKSSLYQRLALSLSIVFVLIVTGVLFWWQKVDSDAQRKAEQSLHLSLAANLAHDNPQLQDGVYDKAALKNLFHTLMVLGPAFEFYLLDPEGNILTYSAAKEIARKKIDVTPLKLLTQNRAQLPILGDDPRHLTRKKIFSASPIFNGHELQSYLYVIIGSEAYDLAISQFKQNETVEFSIVIAVACLLLLLFATLAMLRYVTNPLKLLIGDVKKFKLSGQENVLPLTKWQENSNNEVHQLGSVFNEMAEKIHDQMLKLQQSDLQRRELLAHISHDLRTPLASLQGYLETLNVSDNISAEEMEKYLDTALKNTKQLKLLIDQIFELAYLESGQVQISMENFSLNELVFDVLAKFNLKAENKGIKLVAKVEDSNVFIYSDIGKLERVISNLLENAIRHTPKGGEIALVVNQTSPLNCYLTVSDTGTGIDNNELSYIFDARYRGNNAINDQQKHAGLGLTITKKLLNLLNADIQVHSALGKGTDFVMSLRCVNEG